MKQIKVIKENCIGCGACVAIDSEHFEFDEEGKSSVISNDNLESANLVNAIESCPTSAIEIKNIEGSETTTEEKETNCSCENHCYLEEETNCECEECHCDNCECQNIKEEQIDNEN